MLKIAILANVAAAVSRKTNKNGKEFVVSPVAVTAQKDRTFFCDVITNGKQADVVEEFANVGRSVYVEGLPNLGPRKTEDGKLFANLSIRGDYVRLQDNKGGSRGLAQATAIGRLVEDAESGQTEKGTDRTRARLAVNFKVGEQERTEYLSITAFGGLAGVLGYATKGQKVLVVGDVEPRVFERKNGEVGAELSVTTNKVVLMAKPDEEKGSSDAPANADAQEESSSDDIPF